MIFLYGLIGFGVGICLFISPLFIPDRFLSTKHRERAANFFYDCSCRFFSRMCFLSRKHGTIEIYGSVYDESKLAEKIILGKKSEAFFEDPYNGCVHSLFNRECMFADERVSFIFDPMLATVSEEIQRFHRAGGHKKVLKDKGEEIPMYCGHMFIPDSRSFIDLKSITCVLPSSGNPLLGSTIRFFIEMSQAEYKSLLPILQMALGLTFFITGFICGAGVVWLMEENPLPPGIVDQIPLIIGALL